ncbi:hypothetical protein [uncultured Roseobacter sp.]|uniref:hypothetical protein n=1 Tax=uncultured Roseobacter sp. TaxID=114847 RepID=UPI002610129E|nr:hypothetical protein [uncultured Roseobacter sp.]
MIIDVQFEQVKFHIGAPCLAANLVKRASDLPEIGGDGDLHVLPTDKYRQHLRSFVNTGEENFNLTLAERRKQDKFRARLGQYKYLSASQHVMLSHAKSTIRDGIILPGAEARVERLASAFQKSPLELHLTITGLTRYLHSLHAAHRSGSLSEYVSGSIPSWSEAVRRIREASEAFRLVVWDFSDPARVALPFTMTLLHAREAWRGAITRPVDQIVLQEDTLERMFVRERFSAELTGLLQSRYAQDLEEIAQLENTVLIGGATADQMMASAE